MWITFCYYLDMEQTIKDYMAEIGRKGGLNTKKNHGKGFFSVIGKMNKKKRKKTKQAA